MRFLKRFIGQHCTVVGQNGLLVYCTHKHHENDEGARANKTCIECASRKFYCPLLIFFSMEIPRMLYAADASVRFHCLLSRKTKAIGFMIEG